jgi:GT2 family glycosyltransferase
VAVHIGGAASGRASAFAVYHGHRNLEWTFVKNMPASLLLRFLPLHIASSIAAIGWFAFRRHGATILRSKWDALLGARRVWRQRLEVQQGRVVDDHMVLALLDRTPLRTRLTARASRSAT